MADSPLMAQVDSSERVSYRLKDASGREWTLLGDERASALPVWTELSCEKCPGCPLADEPGARCPAAVAVAPMIEAAKSLTSFERVEVTVTTREREFRKTTSVQEALRSALGLRMSTSGCPVLEPLRALARFHLPFATPEETLFRAAGLFALRAEFEGRIGWLQDLRETYARLGGLNQAFSRRLRTACKGDASINAVVNLFSLSTILADEIDGGVEGLREVVRRRG